jgi:hypothetical protein
MGNYAAIHMIQIRLHGSQIRLEPPQRMAMIEVKRLGDGFTFKVIHKSGHESEDESESIDLPATPEVLQWIAELQLKSSAPAHQVSDKQFPLVSVLDLIHLPEQYRLIPDVLPENFEFVSGEDYRVFVIGQEWVETVVTAT